MAKALFSMGGSSGLGWSDFLEVCQTCDELGFWGFYPSDHLMQVGAGRGPTPKRLEGLTVMAAMAGHTKNLRLGMLVMNNNLRHPVITAKMVNTIDHASGGRAELGIGSGNYKAEFDVHGIPFPGFGERLDRLDEALSVIRALWTQEKANFEGRYYSLHDAPTDPHPVQQPHPPIIVGGTGERTMRVAAKHATDYNQIAPLEDVRANLVKMEAICAETGGERCSTGPQIVPLKARAPRSGPAIRPLRPLGSNTGHTASISTRHRPAPDPRRTCDSFSIDISWD